MSVDVLIITQGNIGAAMLACAKTTFGELPLKTTVVNVTPEDDPSVLIPRLQQQLAADSHPDGVLILTDLFGSTPCNIASALQQQPAYLTYLISGLNMPMLIRIMNYPDSSLEQLTALAIEGGKRGIIEQPLVE